MGLLGKIATRWNTLIALGTDRRMRDFHGQRQELERSVRDRRAERIAATLPAAAIASHPNAPAHLRALRAEGYSQLTGHFSKSMIEGMRSFLATKAVHDPHRPELGEFAPTSPRSPETNLAYYSDSLIPHIPGALAIANDPLVLEVVSGALGCKPTISYMATWWTYPSHGGNLKRGEMFHRDVDDFAFVKVFVYLTDVGPKSGPHEFIKGSHRQGGLTQRIDNFQDEDVFSTFDRGDVVQFTGPAGTAFFEDTFGLHRGRKPDDHPRLVFQTLYSLRPLPYGPRRPYLSAAKLAAAAELDPHVNRVYLQF